ncbi:MAG: mycofactocin system FadH/OYE family oxidoreductase 2 [Proteobacteria bacterium]|nr:mycofactocin system FadH/OYE family oxidoreductase 2 [Pseudomonadota bacterium]
MKNGLKLFDSLRIGEYTLKNRIVLGPHRTNFSVDHVPGKRHMKYYERRAMGGAGMIVVEGASVHPSDFPYERAIFVFDDKAVHGYKLIAEAVHAHSCLVLAQLTHCGGQADSTLSQTEVWAPSPVPEVNSGEIPKAMEKEDIEDVIEGFASAALRMQAAGLKGVEINAGQLSLLRQFLSPLTNFRTDEYGGSMENRARVCLDVLLKVREEVGPAFIIGLRLCGDEYAPWGGLTPEQSRDIATYLCQDGLVDYLAVELGSIYSVHMTMASMRHPEDYAVEPARIISDAVKVPVCATGSIVSVELAERLVQEGMELVEMTRALIADPMLPSRARESSGAEIRPCILCNQDCYVYSGMNPVLSCAVNPCAGYEEESHAELARISRTKQVVVVGGGPGGLQAAVNAAERGHQVILYEREKAVGGRIRLLARIPGCARFQIIIDYLLRRAKELGVEFNLGCEVNESDITKICPDAVIIAVGRKWAPIPFEVERNVSILRPEEILKGNANVGRNALIVDLEGAWQAVGASLSLAERVDTVQIVTPEMFVSSELAKNGEFVNWYQQAFQKGINFIPQTEVARVSRSTVEVVDKFGRESRKLTGIDTVVLAAPGLPDQQLYKSLLGKGLEIWAVGDCVAPRNLSAAIREGYQVGSRI